MVLIGSLMILLGIGVLAYLSRGEPGDLLERMSGILYDFFCRMPFPTLDSAGVETDLERLHPEASLKELKRAYYMEKLRLMLLILLVGALLCLCLQGKLWIEETVSRTGVIERPDTGKGEEVHLEARVSGEKEAFSVMVSDRQLTEEELQGLFKECAKELEVLILGENSSLLQISGPLELVEEVEGYPFEITWNSSDYTLINREGEVLYESGDVAQTVELTANIYYGDICYEHIIPLQIVPTESSNRENSLKDELMQAVMEQEILSRYEETVPLPVEVSGKPVRWKEIKEDNSPLFLLLTIGAAVGVYFLKDKDLHDELLEKKRAMKMYYPVILNKFVLYMGAGMTVRGSFVKIALDYQKKREEIARNPAYEEMLYSCNELNAGISEGLVYERFGRRSGLQEYARFTAMLSQNLKKGNSALLTRLREESDKALADDLHYRKKLGEEAETKLLVPMIMMMAIVMLLVMIPAFSSLE